MKEPYDVVRVISGGRVVIPKGLRQLLKIKEGDYLAVYVENNSIKFVPVEIKPKLYSTK